MLFTATTYLKIIIIIINHFLYNLYLHHLMDVVTNQFSNIDGHYGNDFNFNLSIFNIIKHDCV